MLNLNGVFKLIKVNAKGTTKDGRTFVNVSAVNFFDQTTTEQRENGEKDRFYALSAFGSTADYILKNFKDSNGTRRAFISGKLELQDYTVQEEVSKKATINGKKYNLKFNVDITKVKAGIIVEDIRFLDKPNSKPDDEVTIEDDVDDDEAVVVCEDDDEAPVGEHTNVVEEEKKKSSKKKGSKKKDELPETIDVDENIETSAE